MPAYLAKQPEIVAEDFPGYAPELNRTEQVGNWTKRGPLAKQPAGDSDWLFDQLIASMVDLKQRPDLLRAVIHHSGLPLIEDTSLATAA